MDTAIAIIGMGLIALGALNIIILWTFKSDLTQKIDRVVAAYRDERNLLVDSISDIRRRVDNLVDNLLEQKSGVKWPSKKSET